MDPSVLEIVRELEFPNLTVSSVYQKHKDGGREKKSLDITSYFLGKQHPIIQNVR